MFDPSDGPLTLDQVRDYAGRVVARKGRDFVYNRSGRGADCSYLSIRDALSQGYHLSRFGLVPEDATPEEVADAMPSVHADPRWDCACLAGSVLDEAGITFHHSVPFETAIEEIATHIDPDDPTGSRYFEGGYQGLVMQYLVILQNRQDEAMSWGVALDTAEHAVRNYLGLLGHVLRDEED